MFLVYGGQAWSTGGWALVAALAGTLTLGTLVLSLYLRTVPAVTRPAQASDSLDILGATP